MVEREKRGEGFFRTVFLYPLAISLIVTGLVWRWMFNPTLGIQGFLRGLGFEDAAFNWLAQPDTAMYAIILASIWHGLGFYMALMLAGLKSINTEIWSAARLDGVSLLAALHRDHHPDDEVHLPHLRHPPVARRGEGLRHRRRDDQWRARAPRPGRRPISRSTPIRSRSNIGFASAAAVIMLLITLAIFLPLVLLTAWQMRRREAAVQ